MTYSKTSYCLNLMNSSEFETEIQERSFSLKLPVTIVGRGETADWTLPDPTRFLSGHHFQLILQKDTIVFEDLSSNGCTVNGHSTSAGHKIPLAGDAIIEFGPFRAQLTAIPSTGSTTSPQDQTIVAAFDQDDKTQIAATDLPDHTVFQPQNSTSPIQLLQEQRQSADSVFLEAFCKGAGLEMEPLSPSEAYRTAYEMGQLLRLFTFEISKMLHSQTELKALIQAKERTRLKQADNNPLKFLPDPQEIVELFYKRDMKGFLSAPESFKEALEEIETHEKIFFQAMQTSLFRLMNDFTPEEIEKKNKAWLPVLSNAAHWKAYQEVWETHNLPYENGILDIFMLYLGEAYNAAAANQT